MLSVRTIGVLVAAFVAAVLLAVEPFVGTLVLRSTDVSYQTLDWVQALSTVLIVAVHPVGTAIVGFVWGRAADVPSDISSVGVGTAIAAAIGAAAATVVVGLALVFDSGSGGPTSTGRLVIGLGTVVVRTALAVPVAVIAGAALAHFFAGTDRTPVESRPNA